MESSHHEMNDDEDHRRVRSVNLPIGNNNNTGGKTTTFLHQGPPVRSTPQQQARQQQQQVAATPSAPSDREREQVKHLEQQIAQTEEQIGELEKLMELVKLSENADFFDDDDLALFQKTHRDLVEHHTMLVGKRDMYRNEMEELRKILIGRRDILKQFSTLPQIESLWNPLAKKQALWKQRLAEAEHKLFSQQSEN